MAPGPHKGEGAELSRERGGQGPACPSVLERMEPKGARPSPGSSEQGRQSGIHASPRTRSTPASPLAPWGTEHFIGDVR